MVYNHNNMLAYWFVLILRRNLSRTWPEDLKLLSRMSEETYSGILKLCTACTFVHFCSYVLAG